MKSPKYEFGHFGRIWKHSGILTIIIALQSGHSAHCRGVKCGFAILIKQNYYFSNKIILLKSIWQLEVLFSEILSLRVQTSAQFQFE